MPSHKRLVVSPFAAALVIAGCGGMGPSARTSRPATSTHRPAPDSAVGASAGGSTSRAGPAKKAAAVNSTPHKRAAVARSTRPRRATVAKTPTSMEAPGAKTTARKKGTVVKTLTAKKAKTATRTSPSTPAKPTATVALRRTSLGKIITGSHGRTLYLFAADKSMSSTCKSSCVSVWPPLTVSGRPVAGPGLRASLLGTTKRAGGSTQVTYDGHPLYYCAGDSRSGMTSGQGLTEFGAKWYVLSANGTEITRS